MPRQAKPSLKRQALLKVLIVVLVVMGGGLVGLRIWYNHNLSPVSSSASADYFAVEPGTSLKQIAKNLKRAGLIRSSGAFETYVRSHELNNDLQAGTYKLSQSMSVAEIVNKMVNGDVSKNLLTILPGKRLDEIKKAFIRDGYKAAEVEAAFKPDQYRHHPALANLPRGASLEGYLYPDSYQRLSSTPAATIVRQSLDEMDKYLTPELAGKFAARGLSPHQAVTLASVVYKESDNPADQAGIAQVFLTRLKIGMPLQSDPTAYYAADKAKTARSLRYPSPYNTYLHKGLPPGPISNFDKSALQAVANPAKSNYLYFVSGDDDKTYFSKTQAEHEEKVRKYCRQKCAL